MDWVPRKSIEDMCEIPVGKHHTADTPPNLESNRTVFALILYIVIQIIGTALLFIQVQLNIMNKILAALFLMSICLIPRFYTSHHFHSRDALGAFLGGSCRSEEERRLP